MLKRFSLIILSIFLFTTASYAQKLKVNNRDVHEGDSMVMFYDDLDTGRINFLLSEYGLKKAEITFDKGRSWFDMEEEGDSFIYKYHPLSNEIISPEMLLTIEGKGVQTYRPNLRINYSRQKPDQEVEQILEKMKTFYENEDKNRFLSLFSSAYPDRVKFEQAVQNDFYNYKNIRLFYRIDTRAFDDNLGGAVWNVYWQRKYQDRNGNDLTDSSANIAMRFDKESGNWLVTGLRNNTIFGSSLLVAIDAPVLEISSADITRLGGASPNEIKAVVHNTGTAAANNVQVKFYGFVGGGVIPTLIGSETISSISAGSTGFATHDCGSVGSPAKIRIDIDPFNLITPADPNKKTATVNSI